MILSIIIKAIHFIVCIGLIVIVLLQADKGEGLAGAFGGGASGTVFGDRGAGGIMPKITTGMAVIFMITSLIMAVWLPRWTEDNKGASPLNTLQTSGSTKLPSDLPVSPEAPPQPQSAPDVPSPGQ